MNGDDFLLIDVSQLLLTLKVTIWVLAVILCIYLIVFVKKAIETLKDIDKIAKDASSVSGKAAKIAEDASDGFSKIKDRIVGKTTTETPIK